MAAITGDLDNILVDYFATVITAIRSIISRRTPAWFVSAFSIVCHFLFPLDRSNFVTNDNTKIIS